MEIIEEKREQIREIVKIYEDVVDRLCNLFIRMGIQDDPVKIYEVFMYMFNNGFLSNDQKFKKTIPSDYIQLELDSFFRMDVVGSFVLSGYGICRHTTDFLYHIFEKLGYDCSKIFTYHPEIGYIVKHKRDLNCQEVQEYMNEATRDFDYFSKEEQHYTRFIDDVEVKIDYTPKKIIWPANHIMNIVADRQAGKAHILDTRLHRLGVVDEANTIKLFNLKKYYVYSFITKCYQFLPVPTYYGKFNYPRAMELLEYDIDIEKDLEKAILCCELNEDYRQLYETFWTENETAFSTIDNEFKMLIKKNNESKRGYYNPQAV